MNAERELERFAALSQAVTDAHVANLQAQIELQNAIYRLTEFNRERNRHLETVVYLNPRCISPATSLNPATSR
jgi:hypothetical protein